MSPLLFPDSQTAWLKIHLHRLGHSLEEAWKLAPHILELSTHYQCSESKTPWQDSHMEAAYLAYFYPLNYMRLQKVFREAQLRDFFKDLTEVVDFGSGPGPVTQLLRENKGKHTITKVLSFDTQPTLSPYYLKTDTEGLEAQYSTAQPQKASHPQQALMMSYALNELDSLPDWMLSYDHIFVVEPSTQSAFERVVELRTELINKDYKILAPCPHQLSCSMASRSGDWCHDALFWKKPDWFQRLEDQLPMKNSQLTFSYLIGSRHQQKNQKLNSIGRIVGDMRKEKGKVRWQLCWDDQRRFLSHLKRSGRPPKLLRGDLVKIKNHQDVGLEMRVQAQDLELIESPQPS